MERRQQLAQFLQELEASGVADHNFEQLLSLEDKEDPRFVEEVVHMFMEKSRAIHDEAQTFLSAADYTNLFQSIHHYKGSSATIGAHEVAKICGQICEASKAQDGDLCSSLLTQLKSDASIFNKHMEKFLDLYSEARG